MEGIIVSYDKKTVTLSQGGERTQVPRKAIPSHFKIKSGNQVYALFDGKDVMKKLIKEKDTRKKEVKAKSENKSLYQYNSLKIKIFIILM